jgi:EmrB/QacA subfamily drug resistance transporter
MHASEHGAPRKWLTLLAMTGSLCMILLDTTVVGVALPTMQADLNLSQVQAQWVVNAYVLALASLVALGGRAADTLGRVPVFVAGVTLFAASSAACALAGGAAEIIGWRAMQGVAAAIMQPASASLVVNSFAPGERGKAMAVYAGIPMLFLAAGPPIGGAVTQWAGWSWNFWLNLPVAALALVLTAVARPVEARTARRGADPLGAVLLLTGLPAFVFGLMEGAERGWADATVWLAIGAGSLLLPVFLWWEWRHPSPLLAVRLLADRVILADCMILASMQFALVGLVIFGSVYLQAVMDMDPLKAGVAMLPLLLPLLLVVHVGGRLYDRRGLRLPALLGTSLATLGMAVQAIAASLQHYPLLALGMVTLGTGVGLVMSPTNVDAMSRAGAAQRGQASGVSQTFRQVGGCLGVAVVGAVIMGMFTRGVRHELADKVSPEDLQAVQAGMLEALRGRREALDGMRASDPVVRAAHAEMVSGAVAAGWWTATAAMGLAWLVVWRSVPAGPASTLRM